MAGKMKGKGSGALISANELEVHVHKPMEGVEAPEREYPPPRVEIKKAKGGYIACKYGGKNDDYMNNEAVYASLEDALQGCKSFLEGDT